MALLFFWIFGSVSPQKRAWQPTLPHLFQRRRSEKAIYFMVDTVRANA
jgi:hypothetical protein